MALAKRIVLFLLINLSILLLLTIVLSIFNAEIHLKALALFCFFWGLGGSLISLYLSKDAAETMGVQLIDANTKDPHSHALLQMVHTLSRKSGLQTSPEVGVYDSPEVNAFTTGASKNYALIAVSTGMIRRLNTDQIEGILGHEIAHISNGDMATMTLLQGIINAFSLSFLIKKSQSKDWIMKYSVMLLGTIVAAHYSKFREFHADILGAHLSSPDKMISALTALQKNAEIEDSSGQTSFNCLKIAGRSNFINLFATHPTIEKRIANIQKQFLKSPQE